MRKHTPGPWRQNLYLGGAYAIDHIAPNGDILARVAVVDGLMESKANALLIAAAPDLLEACKKLITGWQSDTDTLQVAIDAARAAIAKAEGEVMP